MSAAALPARIHHRRGAAAWVPAGAGDAARGGPGTRRVRQRQSPGRRTRVSPALPVYRRPGRLGWLDLLGLWALIVGRAHRAGCCPPGGRSGCRDPAGRKPGRSPASVRLGGRIRPAATVARLGSFGWVAAGSGLEWKGVRRGPGDDADGRRLSGPEIQLGVYRIDSQERSAVVPTGLVDWDRWALRCPLSATQGVAGDSLGTHARN